MVDDRGRRGIHHRRRARRDDRPGGARLLGELGHHLERSHATRGAGRDRRSDAVAGRRQLPGCVPQSARGSVPVGSCCGRRPWCHDHLCAWSRRDERVAGRSTASGFVRGRPRRSDDHLSGRRGVRRVAIRCDPGSRRCRRRFALHGYPDLRVATQQRRDSRGLLLDTRASFQRDVGRRPPRPAIRRGVFGRPVAAPTAPRPLPSRRRRGGLTRFRRRQGADHRGGRGDHGHRSGGERQRAHRVRWCDRSSGRLRGAGDRRAGGGPAAAGRAGAPAAGRRDRAGPRRSRPSWTSGNGGPCGRPGRSW